MTDEERQRYERDRQWYEHAQAAGFVILLLSRPFAKGDPPKGWTARGSKVWGKYPADFAAFAVGLRNVPSRDRGTGEPLPPRNLAIGTERGGRGIIVDADDDTAVAAVTALLDDAGVVTLSETTPRGVAWLFTLPEGVDLPKLNETMVGGLGLLGTRPAGHYQVGPGSVVGVEAYGPNKPPPDESGGPWEYRCRDVAPVAVMPAKLVEAIRGARAQSRGEAEFRDALAAARAAMGDPGRPLIHRPGVKRPRRGRRALDCRTVGIGVEVLRDLVRGEGGGRNDSVYRVACSLVWHGALTAANRGDVEAQLIDVQRELRAGESRDVTREVPEQIDHAFEFIARQGGPGRGSDTGDIPESNSGFAGEHEPVPPAPDDLAGDLATWADWRDSAAKFKPSSPGALKREAPALLRQVMGRFADGEGEADSDDAGATLDALAVAFDAGGEAAVRQALEARGLTAKLRGAVAVPDVAGERPAPLLRLAGESGAVLSLGTVGVLSGEGGMGKSAFTASLALSLATQGDGDGGKLAGGMFDAPNGGGPVLMATWEDSAAVTRWRIEAAAKVLQGVNGGAAGRVFLMDLAGAPLYGPRSGGDDRPGLYNARPEPLQGWRDLWREVKRIGPRLVVIDPVLASFVGNSNEAAPVREFLSALAVEAARHDTAVLLVAHSTKAARKGDKGGEPDPFDPGHVGGSAAWTDGVRSAMVLGWDDARGPGERRLAVAKSNYGPARRLLPLEPVKVGGDDAANAGAIVAFKAAGQWAERGAGAPKGRKRNDKAGAADDVGGSVNDV